MGEIQTDRVDICVITTIHPPYDGRIYKRGVQALSSAGFSMALIAPWAEPKDKPRHLKWHSASFPERRIERLLHGFRTFITAWRQDAAVYYFHDLDFIIWAVFLRVFKNRQVVYDCHENYPEEILYHKHWIPKFLRKPAAWVTQKLEDWCVRIIGNVVVVVPYQAARFSRVGANTTLVRNFANWAPLRDLDHKHALVCTGTLSPSYGSGVLLDIARELKKRRPNVSLVIVDRFVSEPLKSQFLSAVERERLPVRVHPRVYPEQMHQILSMGSIGIAVEQDTPEKRVALPTKLFEYMAFGLPIIASDLPYTREVIEHARCGVLVPASSASAYVEEALRLLDSPERFKRMQENGFNAIDSEYNWPCESRKLVHLAKTLVEKGNHKGNLRVSL